MPTWIIRGDKLQATAGIISMQLDMYEHHKIMPLSIGDKIYYSNSDGIEHICKLVDIRIKEHITLTMEIIHEKQILPFKHLRKIWGLKNLDLFRLDTIKFQRLSMKEDLLIQSFLEIPGSLPDKAKYHYLDNYLYLFQKVAQKWLGNENIQKERYRFFREFSKEEHLTTMNWKEVQAIGDQLNAFQFPFAKERALGKQREPLEKYRNSFLFLTKGEGAISDRIQLFYANTQFKLIGFGHQAIGEMMHNIFPTYFCRLTSFESLAVEILYGEDPKQMLSIGMKIQYYQDLIEKSYLPEKYLEIVGRRTELPIYYEVSCFLYYFYKVHIENKLEQFSEKEDSQYWLYELASGGIQFDRGLLTMHHGKLGNILTYKNKQVLWKTFRQKYRKTKIPYLKISALYQFCHEMKVGDYVIIKNGSEKLIALGRITSDYMFPKFPNAPSYRKIEWIKTGSWQLKERLIFQNKLMNITNFERTLTYLMDQFTELSKASHLNGRCF
ncbi:hypothetical protein [Sutcliffiella rhizosphaerae]|uniref:Uncharacterized protein n=1 Tax=Sutcliffiella rhizosphaerae TaxID=2880967 RepID=A0ABM8YPC8_9BACI|nr:hypothetical protein [Sutcliffiella rhizosphaerae]CAG9621614.1 hypothetical protein BACCIP111883_02387 [Sutcliffiella rhizosphaerae]